MYCFLRYIDKIPFDTLSLESQDLSLIKSSVSTNQECDLQEILINPNCYSQILLDFIYEQTKLNKIDDIDLCNASGEIVKIKSLKPYAYATEVLIPQNIYYIVLVERGENGDYLNAEVLLDRRSKLYSEMTLKVKRYLLLPSITSLDSIKKSKRSKRAKSSSNSISSKSSKQKSVDKLSRCKSSTKQ